LSISEPETLIATGPDVCTPAESQRYRSRLHEVGLDEFIQETLGKGAISARKLCSAFNARIPPWLDGEASDEAFYQLLGLALVRELEKRQRLPQYTTIDDAAKLLNSAKNVMIITGAGVSTSLGIPDFRSKDSGFYTKLLEKGFAEPEDVFELSTFDEDPTIFYSLAGDILPEFGKWTPTHQFIRLLQDKGKLLRNYTQNIDNIEGNAGIDADKLVQCHGSWATATCRKCQYQVSGEQIFEDVRSKRVAHCKRCIAQLQVPGQGMKRKRSSNGNSNAKSKSRSRDSDDDSDGQYDIPEPGVMKPDITFFGEKLPETFFDRLTEHDRDKVDFVIVMGTSMKVAPVSEIPGYLPAHVPQMYISKDVSIVFDALCSLPSSADAIIADPPYQFRYQSARKLRYRRCGAVQARRMDSGARHDTQGAESGGHCRGRRCR